MEHLISRIADSSATITSGGTGTQCRVRELGEVSSAFDAFGVLHYYKSYLVAPIGFTPSLPATLTIGSSVYEVASVKPYRSVSGEDLGFRITVAQG